MSLAEMLQEMLWMNNGTVTSSQVFVYEAQKVSYNEPDNVTCSMCQWHVGTPWHYLWQKNGPPPPPPPPPPPHMTLVQDCQRQCCEKKGCVGFLFEAHSDYSGGNCKKGGSCCWTKSAVKRSGAKSPSIGATVYKVSRGATCDTKAGLSTVCTNCDSAGADAGSPFDPAHPTPPTPSSNPNVIAPPMGIRSSPALGGVSTGSTELRADGSFREWTIFNQGPAGAGKYGWVDDVWMAARVGGKAKMLRTHPPAYATAAAVDAMTFSGTYPATRLQVSDAALTPESGAKVSVFAYSTLKPTDLKASAYPAVVLSLSVENTGAAATEASFMLNLPFGAWTDCSRPPSSNSTAAPTTDKAGCMKACASSATCASWDLTKGKCMLNSGVPLTHHSVGSYCGIKSKAGWVLKDGGLTRSTRPLSSGPSMGDMTLRPVLGAGVSATFASGDDAAALYKTFAASGAFPAGSVGSADAGNGAVAVSAKLAAGAKTTISLVFAWHFPDRDFSGQILGNMYTELWASSAAVAKELAVEDKLISVVADINAHHYSVASPDNPTPLWLKDQLLNQWSHFHMLMWYKDGRLREYEAWSCDDVDSVHNDYQRHLLYLWAYPEFELNKMAAWSTFAQRPDGSIWESLGYTGKPMDVGGGRYMGDTTSLYLLEMYEIYRHNGNKTFIASQWNSAQRATAWMISNAMGNDTYGLPQKLSTTYDHFGFSKRRTVAYNGHVYLTALGAVERMAAVLGDSATAASAAKALQLGQKRLTTPTSEGGPLWDGAKKFWHAHSETPTQIFTDSLYGQMLGHHHLQNFSIDASFLSEHLAYEWKRNQDKYGMRVLNDPVQEDSIWMNGPPTWTYLQLAMGKLPREQAMEPFKRMSENFRTRLRDQWNLRALTHTDGSMPNPETTRAIELGAPREQGHYGFMLTDLFLIPLLSGQIVDMASSGVQLQLNPMYPAPYTMPVLISGVEGSISATAGGKFTLAVAFGKLELHAGGLVVAGKPCAKAVSLEAGQSISW